MGNIAAVKVWNFDLPPYNTREGLFHRDMSSHCQVNRLLTFEAGRLSHLHQLGILEDRASLGKFQKGLRARLWEKFGCSHDPGLPLSALGHGAVDFVSPRTSGGTPLTPAEIRKLRKEIRPVRAKRV